MVITAILCSCTATALRRGVHPVRASHVAHLPETVPEAGRSAGQRRKIGPRARTRRLEGRGDVAVAVSRVRHNTDGIRFRRLHQTATVLGPTRRDGRCEIRESSTPHNYYHKYHVQGECRTLAVISKVKRVKFSESI